MNSLGPWNIICVAFNVHFSSIHISIVYLFAFIPLVLLTFNHFQNQLNMFYFEPLPLVLPRITICKWHCFLLCYFYNFKLKLLKWYGHPINNLCLFFVDNVASFQLRWSFKEVVRIPKWWIAKLSLAHMFMAIMVTPRTNHSNSHSFMSCKLGICGLGFFQLQQTWDCWKIVNL
jgi:hypothetical protein